MDYAVAQEVDVVALSGDVVDQANRYYESLGPLERGLRRLGAAGIATVAVTGNHDFAVLPELARSLPHGYLRLLGVGGRWERTTIAAKDGALLHVDGWSFPTQHVRESPLAAYTLPAADDAPVLGLLHADLDQMASAYGPVALADLHAKPVAMWLLGHVHAPALRSAAGKPPVLYPGSPQPLDPGETGVHGAWVVDLSHGQPVSPQQVPVASVRYESIDVDVTGATRLEDVHVVMVQAVRAAADRFAGDAGVLRHLSLRIRLTGRSALHRELARDGARAIDLDLDINDLSVYVERVDPFTRPERDLGALAAGNDAAASIARLLESLDGGHDHEEHRELLRSIASIPDTLQAAKAYRSLPANAEEYSAARLRAQLGRQANLLLDELLSQKGSRT